MLNRTNTTLLGALLLSTSLGLFGCGSDQQPVTTSSITTTTTTGGTSSTTTTATGGSSSTTTTGTGGVSSTTTTSGGTSSSTSGTTTGGTSGTTTGGTVGAPIAVADSYTGRANAEITTTAANGLLANDTPNGAAITANTTPAHGALALSANGSFTYTPTTGYLGTDSFTYTLTNAQGSSTATATITLSGLAFFVDNQAAVGGDGSQAHPFTTLAQAQRAATGVDGAQIVVFQGDGTSTGYDTAVTLSADQSLVGFSATAAPLLTGPIAMTGGNNTLAYVSVEGTVGNAVDGTGAAGGTITNCTIANSTGFGVNLVNSTGTWLVADSTATNVSGILAQSNAGNLTWTVSNCTCTQGGSGVQGNVTGAAVQNLTVTNCTFTNLSTALNIPAVGVSTNSTSGTMYLTDLNNVATNVFRDVDVLNQGSTYFSGLIQANTVTNTSDDGMEFETLSTSAITKLHVYDNSVKTIEGNIGESFNSAGTNYDLDLNNNTASAAAVSYSFGTDANNPSLNITISNLNTIESRNSGTFDFTGGNETNGTFTFP